MGIQQYPDPLHGKADDSSVVHKTGAETISDVKSYTTSPTVPTPTSYVQAANKGYVDEVFTAFVTGSTNGAQTTCSAGETTLATITIPTGHPWDIINYRGVYVEIGMVSGPSGTYAYISGTSANPTGATVLTAGLVYPRQSWRAMLYAAPGDTVYLKVHVPSGSALIETYASIMVTPVL